MRNRKENNRLLYMNRRTGEFIRTRRFNSRDYILTSVFDNEVDWPEEWYGLNESFLDELYDEDDDDVYDRTFASVDGGISMTTVRGGDIIIDVSEEYILDSFLRYVSNMLLIDDADVDVFKSVENIVVNSGVKNSCRIFFKRVLYRNGVPRFVVSNKPGHGIGYIELQWLDDSMSRISILVYPIGSKGSFGFSKIYSSMSYEHYQVINTMRSLTLKYPADYYDTLVRELVSKFNGAGMNVTLTRKRDEWQPMGRFAKTVTVYDNSFMRVYLKPLGVYGPGRDTPYSYMEDAVAGSLSLIEGIYGRGDEFDPKAMYEKDMNYIIIAQAKRFFSRYNASIWNEKFAFIDNMVKMCWLPKDAVSVSSKKYAIAMPLSMFMYVAPIFYIMLSDDPIV